MTASDSERSRRSATVRTTHDDAELVAAALAPDNTDSMDARVEGDTIVCSIERPTTGGLRSTTDDYVVNLRVADRIVERARTYRSTDDRHADDRSTDDRHADDQHTNGGADEASPSDVIETSTDDADEASPTDTTSTHNE